MTQEIEFDPTARILADTLNTEPPPDVEARMRERLEGLRQKMESPSLPSSVSRNRSRRWFLSVSALAALSAAILIAIILFPLGSSEALAQIAEAVAGKKWLHATGIGPDGKPAEMWFSAKNGILGCRNGDSFVLVGELRDVAAEVAGRFL